AEFGTEKNRLSEEQFPAERNAAPPEATLPPRPRHENPNVGKVKCFSGTRTCLDKEKTMQHWNRSINLGMITLLVFLGITAADAKRKTEPPPPESVKVSVKIPTFAPLGETQSMQEKGGLKISVAPV